MTENTGSRFFPSKKRFFTKNLLQSDPNKNLQMAITPQICISDPMLVKPKCVLGAYIYFNLSARGGTQGGAEGA